MNRRGYVVLVIVLILALAALYITGARMYGAVSTAQEQPQVSSTTSQELASITSYKFNVQLTTYIVKAGDTLWWIAVRNRTTVDSIKILNRMQDDNLYVGDKLTIPGTVTVTGYTAAPAPQPQQPPTGGSVSAEAYQILQLVNAERAKAGVTPLTLSPELSRVAQEKARDMADNDYFSHTSPTYGSPFDMIRQFGISYSYAGENIAKGYTSPQAVMRGWMNSSGHRANILNPNYTQIGVGVKDTVWVQQFMKPL